MIEGFRELGFDYGMYLVWAITVLLAVVGTNRFTSWYESKRRKGK